MRRRWHSRWPRDWSSDVCFSDLDAEMARRLHSEAGKAMKYGGLTEEEALKLVTLNPAKMLHIDDRVGKIKKGMEEIGRASSRERKEDVKEKDEHREKKYRTRLG